MLKVFSAWVLLLFALSGCSLWRKGDDTSPIPIKPPTAYVEPKVEELSPTSRLVWRPKRAAWQHFMLALSRTDFFIDSAIDEDGLMTVRYSGTAAPYVDCGEVVATYKVGENEKTVRFPAATPYQKYQVSLRNKLYQVERRFGMTARTTLTFTTVSPQQTKVELKSAYILNRDQTAMSGSEKPLMLTDSVSFATGETAVFPNAATKCRSTGKLESDLLDALR